MERPSLSRGGGDGILPYIRRSTPRMTTGTRSEGVTEHTMPMPEVRHTPDWKQVVVGMAMASVTGPAPESLAPTLSLEDRARAYLDPTLGSTDALNARDAIDLYRQETGYVLSGEELEEYLAASVVATEGLAPVIGSINLAGPEATEVA